MTTDDAQPEGHPYPFEIGLRTLTRLQGTIFYIIFQDLASGLQVRRQNGVAEVSNAMRAHGLSQQVETKAWDCFRDCREKLEQLPFQNVVLQMFIAWDWFLGKLHHFVNSADRELGSVLRIDETTRNQWNRLTRLPIEDQIDLVTVALEVAAEIRPEDLAQLRELRLVRNLGMHQMWFVDAEYCQKTSSATWAEGELRKLELREIEQWHRCLQTVISRLTSAASQIFREYRGARTNADD